MKKCNLFYLSGLLFFLVAVLNLVTGENHSTAVVCYFQDRAIVV